MNPMEIMIEIIASRQLRLKRKQEKTLYSSPLGDSLSQD